MSTRNLIGAMGMNQDHIRYGGEMKRQAMAAMGNSLSGGIMQGIERSDAVSAREDTQAHETETSEEEWKRKLDREDAQGQAAAQLISQRYGVGDEQAQSFAGMGSAERGRMLQGGEFADAALRRDMDKIHARGEETRETVDREYGHRATAAENAHGYRTAEATQDWGLRGQHMNQEFFNRGALQGGSQRHEIDMLGRRATVADDARSDAHRMGLERDEIGFGNELTRMAEQSYYNKDRDTHRSMLDETAARNQQPRDEELVRLRGIASMAGRVAPQSPDAKTWLGTLQKSLARSADLVNDLTRLQSVAASDEEKQRYQAQIDEANAHQNTMLQEIQRLGGAGHIPDSLKRR